MHDWFLERDVKDAAVILNDKLISDALLNGTLPIKSEHSYSLNSDGDSLPDSPHSLHTKMDGKLTTSDNNKYRVLFFGMILTKHLMTDGKHLCELLFPPIYY